jgi:hypothetical protein
LYLRPIPTFYVAIDGLSDESPKSLRDFSASLSRFSKVSDFRTLAKIQYDDKSLSSASSIVSSIEFDKDDEFFATAGVTRKIKVYEYNNVVLDYREQGLNLPDRSRNTNFVTSTYQKERWRLNLDEEDGQWEHFDGQTAGMQKPNDDLEGDGVPRYPILEMGGRAKIRQGPIDAFIVDKKLTGLYLAVYRGILTSNPI